MSSSRPAARPGPGAARFFLLGGTVAALLLSAAASGARAAPEAARHRPQAAVLIDHLCAQTIGGNEEDRLFGIISIAVRSTIKYVGAVYSPDLIDDSVQNALLALMAACPTLRTTDDAHRLGQLVAIISQQTMELINTDSHRYTKKQIDDASAADLSEELSSREIETWLDGLSPPDRAIALFLYADNIDTAKVAQAVGLSQAAAVKAIADAKSKLLMFVREDNDATSEPPAGSAAISFKQVGPDLATLMSRPGVVHVSGISAAIYAGWSLLATITGLPDGQAVEVSTPFLLLPDTPGKKRMIVVGIDEISNGSGATRRFLLKAYAIDGDKNGSALADGFHLGATTVAKAAALTTIDAVNLADIDKARCLAALYGTGPAPGLCPGSAGDETIAGATGSLALTRATGDQAPTGATGDQAAADAAISARNKENAEEAMPPRLAPPGQRRSGNALP